MRAALLWTINDFPGLGMVSGWSAHGKMACHVCMGEVKAKQLPHNRKSNFYGLHVGFLDKRLRSRPKGRIVCNMCAGITFPPPGKPHSKERADGFGDSHTWIHITSFFNLPYGDSLRLCHRIDVMHTEENVFDNILHTIICSAKTKDTTRLREDLKVMGIMQELCMNGRHRPRARYELTRDQLKLLCKWVHRLKLPDGCSSNLKRCSLFDPMEHLPVHLPEECRLGGPVPSRWMYNIERLQRRMKQKIGNKPRVEGSIAEKYVHEELTHFCSMYFKSGVETAHNLLGRNMVDNRSREPHKLEVFTYPVELLGAYTSYHLDVDSLHVAAHYVLTNMREVAFYITMFEEEVHSRNTLILSDTEMDTMLKAHFTIWFQNKDNMRRTLANDRERADDKIAEVGGTYADHRPPYMKPGVWSRLAEYWGKALATEYDSDYGDSNDKSTASDEDHDMPGSYYAHVPRGGPIIRG
ncbi:hypothetical protein AgCh_033202 [Apium graveolens]